MKKIKINNKIDIKNPSFKDYRQIIINSNPKLRKEIYKTYSRQENKELKQKAYNKLYGNQIARKTAIKNIKKNLGKGLRKIEKSLHKKTISRSMVRDYKPTVVIKKISPVEGPRSIYFNNEFEQERRNI